MNFLQRQIKEDKKGFYTNYGGYRLRPLKPKKTKFKKNDLVSMVEDREHYLVAMKVFDNAKSYEVWQSIKKS